jgi:hypothetical protein
MPCRRSRRRFGGGRTNLAGERRLPWLLSRLTGAAGDGGRVALFNTEEEREPQRTTESGSHRGGAGIGQ